MRLKSGNLIILLQFVITVLKFIHDTLTPERFRDY